MPFEIWPLADGFLVSIALAGKENLVVDTPHRLYTALQHAQRAGYTQVLLPPSKFAWDLLKVLYLEGWIRGFRLDGHRLLVILQYGPDGSPAWTRLQRISKPGGRVYWTSQELQKHARQDWILSTSRGLLSTRGALALGLGGEVLCRLEVAREDA